MLQSTFSFKNDICDAHSIAAEVGAIYDLIILASGGSMMLRCLYRPYRRKIMSNSLVVVVIQVECSSHTRTIVK